MPTIEHLGVSRKIESASERSRLRVLIQKIKQEEDCRPAVLSSHGGRRHFRRRFATGRAIFGRTWLDISAEKQIARARSSGFRYYSTLLRDQLSDDFTAIRVDSEEEYLRIVEFINRIQPRMVNRVKLYTREEPILERYGVQEEIDKALKPSRLAKIGRLSRHQSNRSAGCNRRQHGKFVGRGNARLEDTITKTNMEAVDEIARQIRLRDLGGSSCSI
jgi:ribonuclease G